MTPDAEREARALARRARATLRKTRLGAPDGDEAPLFGADAVSLAHRLTAESWSLSGREMPRYNRSDIPCRFVPRP